MVRSEEQEVIDDLPDDHDHHEDSPGDAVVTALGQSDDDEASVNSKSSIRSSSSGSSSSSSGSSSSGSGSGDSSSSSSTSSASASVKSEATDLSEDIEEVASLPKKPSSEETKSRTSDTRTEIEHEDAQSESSKSSKSSRSQGSASSKSASTKSGGSDRAKDSETPVAVAVAVADQGGSADETDSSEALSRNDEDESASSSSSSSTDDEDSEVEQMPTVIPGTPDNEYENHQKSSAPSSAGASVDSGVSALTMETGLSGIVVATSSKTSPKSEPGEPLQTIEDDSELEAKDASDSVADQAEFDWQPETEHPLEVKDSVGEETLRSGQPTEAIVEPEPIEPCPNLAVVDQATDTSLAQEADTRQEDKHKGKSEKKRRGFLGLFNRAKEKQTNDVAVARDSTVPEKSHSSEHWEDEIASAKELGPPTNDDVVDDLVSPRSETKDIQFAATEEELKSESDDNSEEGQVKSLEEDAELSDPIPMVIEGNLGVADTVRDADAQGYEGEDENEGLKREGNLGGAVPVVAEDAHDADHSGDEEDVQGYDGQETEDQGYEGEGPRTPTIKETPQSDMKVEVENYENIGKISTNDSPESIAEDTSLVHADSVVADVALDSMATNVLETGTRLNEDVRQRDSGKRSRRFLGGFMRLRSKSKDSVPTEKKGDFESGDNEGSDPPTSTALNVAIAAEESERGEALVEQTASEPIASSALDTASSALDTLSSAERGVDENDDVHRSEFMGSLIKTPPTPIDSASGSGRKKNSGSTRFLGGLMRLRGKSTTSEQSKAPDSTAAGAMDTIPDEASGRDAGQSVDELKEPELAIESDAAIDESAEELSAVVPVADSQPMNDAVLESSAVDSESESESESEPDSDSDESSGGNSVGDGSESSESTEESEEDAKSSEDGKPYSEPNAIGYDHEREISESILAPSQRESPGIQGAESDQMDPDDSLVPEISSLALEDITPEEVDSGHPKDDEAHASSPDVVQEKIDPSIAAVKTTSEEAQASSSDVVQGKSSPSVSDVATKPDETRQPSRSRARSGRFFGGLLRLRSQSKDRDDVAAKKPADSKEVQAEGLATEDQATASGGELDVRKQSKSRFFGVASKRSTPEVTLAVADTSETKVSQVRSTPESKNSEANELGATPVEKIENVGVLDSDEAADTLIEQSDQEAANENATLSSAIGIASLGTSATEGHGNETETSATEGHGNETETSATEGHGNETESNSDDRDRDRDRVSVVASSLGVATAPSPRSDVSGSESDESSDLEDSEGEVSGSEESEESSDEESQSTAETSEVGVSEESESDESQSSVTDVRQVESEGVVHTGTGVATKEIAFGPTEEELSALEVEVEEVEEEGPDVIEDEDIEDDLAEASSESGEHDSILEDENSQSADDNRDVEEEMETMANKSSPSSELSKVDSGKKIVEEEAASPPDDDMEEVRIGGLVLKRKKKKAPPNPPPPPPREEEKSSEFQDRLRRRREMAESGKSAQFQEKRKEELRSSKLNSEMESIMARRREMAVTGVATDVPKTKGEDELKASAIDPEVQAVMNRRRQSVDDSIASSQHKQDDLDRSSRDLAAQEEKVESCDSEHEIVEEEECSVQSVETSSSVHDSFKQNEQPGNGADLPAVASDTVVNADEDYSAGSYDEVSVDTDVETGVKETEETASGALSDAEEGGDWSGSTEEDGGVLPSDIEQGDTVEVEEFTEEPMIESAFIDTTADQYGDEDKQDVDVEVGADPQDGAFAVDDKENAPGGRWWPFGGKKEQETEVRNEQEVPAVAVVQKTEGAKEEISSFHLSPKELALLPDLREDKILSPMGLAQESPEPEADIEKGDFQNVQIASDYDFSRSSDVQVPDSESRDVLYPEVAMASDPYPIDKEKEQRPTKTKSPAFPCYRIWLIIVLVVLVVLGLSIGFGVNASRKSKVAPIVAPTSPPATAPTQPPAPVPASLRPTTSAPSASPTFTNPLEQPTFNLICNAGLPNCTLLNDASTPQGMAFRWLLDSNPELLLMPDEQKIQRYALATLYYALNGGSWTLNTGWLTQASECEWYTTGMTSCLANEFVSLELDNNNLQGTLPYEINLLTTLSTISLQNPIDTAVDITGTFPTLTNLTGLLRLDLSGNGLSGPIPETFFAAKTSLLQLSLEGNKLAGSVSSSVSGLTALTDLNLAGNGFTAIPSQLFQLQQLRLLNLQDIGFGGTLPDLSSLTKVEALNLRANGISGVIPSSIGSLTSLSDTLDFSSNAISGPIPTTIGNLVKLVSLFLNDNRLAGQVPASLANLTSLRVIRLDQNDLTGTVPSVVCSLFNATNPLSYIDCGEVSTTCFAYCCQDSSTGGGENSCECVLPDPFQCLQSRL